MASAEPRSAAPIAYCTAAGTCDALQLNVLATLMHPVGPSVHVYAVHPRRQERVDRPLHVRLSLQSHQELRAERGGVALRRVPLYCLPAGFSKCCSNRTTCAAFLSRTGW